MERSRGCFLTHADSGNFNQNFLPSGSLCSFCRNRPFSPGHFFRFCACCNSAPFTQCLFAHSVHTPALSAFSAVKVPSSVAIFASIAVNDLPARSVSRPGLICAAKFNTANPLSSRPTPRDPAPRETEEEWRDPEAVSSPMLIQGVSTRALPESLCNSFREREHSAKSLFFRCGLCVLCGKWLDFCASLECNRKPRIVLPPAQSSAEQARPIIARPRSEASVREPKGKCRVDIKQNKAPAGATQKGLPNKALNLASLP